MISQDLKIRIINCIRKKKYNDTELIEIFDISRDTFYKIKNGSLKPNSNSKRQSKINEPIKKYVINYVVRKQNFDVTKLIQLVEKNFGIIISKSSIYNILKESKVKKKRFIVK
jgi:transposase